MTEQLQPGRELDVLMARAMGWAVYEKEDYVQGWDNLSAEYPCLILGERENDYSVMQSEYDISKPVLWRPSANLLHAFEVDREGWRWRTRETDDWVTTELTVETGQSTSTNYQFNQYTKIVMWGDVDDKPAAYALARCRAVAAWWEANRGT